MRVSVCKVIADTVIYRFKWCNT